MRRAIEGAHLAVVGLGKSGLAAAEVALARGARVSGFDAKAEAVAGAAAALSLDDGVAQADPAALATSVLASRPDIVVISPGFASHAPLYRQAAAAGIPVWSEVELAWHVQSPREDGTFAPWLTVTGSNGKTTTVTMLASILSAAGLKAPAVGNIGNPITLAALSSEVDVFAVELSSFQLHSTYSVRPLAAACLNLAPDHLDWHGGWEAYLAAKARVFEGAQAACLFGAADEATRTLVQNADVAAGARAIGVRRGVPGVGELGVVEDILVDRAFISNRHTHGQAVACLADLSHLSPAALGAGEVPDHVVTNALFAAGLARAAGVEPAAVAEGLRAVEAGRHRIELIRQAGAVSYVDDSKATNAHAAAASLLALPPGRVVWIAGGLAKGATFDSLVAEVRDRLRAVVVIGEDRSELVGALQRHAANIPLFEVLGKEHGDVMDAAVHAAARFAERGDTVLLAPACASMDQFTSYEHRGSEFARAVEEL